MKLYLAGPMTGIPQFNFPAFDRWAGLLREKGYEVLSPHEADPGEVQEIAWASVAGDPAELPESDGLLPASIRNLEGVAQCDGIALLPGWEKSLGSRFEVAAGERFGLEIGSAGIWGRTNPSRAGNWSVGLGKR